MGALDGVRVLEYAGLVAGPYCGRLLADLGAEVIKVEPPEGDPARRYGLEAVAQKASVRVSPLFVHLNTNKHAVTLNLKTESGLELFRKLASRSDIVIEDRPPGELGSMSAGYEDLARLNPALVMTSITPFGQTGPYRLNSAYHINLFNATEGSAVGRSSSGRPTVAGGLLGEYDAGLAAGVATLGALFYRWATGEGQHVDASKLEALAGLQRVDISISMNGDRAPWSRRRMGVGGMMRCKDGYAVITVVEEHQWQYLLEMMGDDELARDPRLSDPKLRRQNAPEIQSRLTAWCREHTKEEVFHLGQNAKCPVGPVMTIPEVLESPQFIDRRFFREIEHPEVGKHRQPSMPFKLSESPWQARRPAPLLGQDNEKIYCQELGQSAEDLRRLRDEGAI